MLITKWYASELKERNLLSVAFIRSGLRGPVAIGNSDTFLLIATMVGFVITALSFEKHSDGGEQW